GIFTAQRPGWVTSSAHPPALGDGIWLTALARPADAGIIERSFDAVQREVHPMRPAQLSIPFVRSRLETAPAPLYVDRMTPPDLFHPAVASWFARTFSGPTA